jgi:serine/threonine protein kinase/tetratricopeptide (TPR) repeat protein
MSTLHPHDPRISVSDTVQIDGGGDGASRRPPLPAGTTVGRYVILGLVGEGGMGTVYKAFDAELNRAVALKMINGDAKYAATRSGGKERLMREAQALARLSHPNVLPVYDVGTFAGEVFIATEFVVGKTLRAWLKAEQRAWAEVLAVMIAAGEGLAAAHRAGLVHRDFKPENVMVGDDGRVRVLDFGLVRAAQPNDASDTNEARDSEPTEERAPDPTPAPPTLLPGELERTEELTRTERLRPSLPLATPTSLPTPDATGQLLQSPLTQLGSIMGTPRYMAPEQHRGDAVDPRTDQFSFAVALYEALYGSQPFAAGSAAELKERVLAGEIVAPARDSKVPRRLWPIVARALASVPERRFATMEALLGELARDPGPARRRWLGLVVGGAIAVAGIVSVVMSRPLHRGLCRGAERSLVGVWDDARKQKVHDALVATKLPYAAATFSQIATLFDRYARDWVAMHTEACEATQLRGEQSPELLDLRMACLSDRLSGFGAEVDVLASADAAVVERANHAAHALPTLDACADTAALRAPTRPPADPATRAQVADVKKQLGRARALEAAGRYRDGLAVASAAAAAATTLHYRPAEAQALLVLGALQNSNGDPKSAAATLRSATLAADAGRADEVRAEALIMLVEVAGEELSQYAEAHAFGEAAEMILQRVDHHEALLASLERNQGIVWWRQGKYDTAVALLDQALALRTRVYGAEDREVAETLSDLADALADEGKLAAALDHYQRALDLWQKTLGSEHPQVGVTLNNMANVLSSEGKLDEALARFRRAQDIWERALGPQHPKVASVLNNIGDTYTRLSRYADALECYRRALPMFEAAYGQQHFSVGVAYVSMSEAERALGRLDAALTANRRGLGILEAALGATHPQLATPLVDLGDVLRFSGDRDGALAAYRRAGALLDKSPERPEKAQALVGIGQLELGADRASEALAPLQQAVALRERYPSDPVALAEARFALAEALWRDGRERARALRLATAARAAYAQAGARGRESLGAVDAWLARRR